MSYFPCDIPFMSKDELEANGIKIHKDTETTDMANADDLISRNAAIDALMEILDRPNHAEFLYTDEICKALKALPSAQPEVLACGEGELYAQPEIVRCKDCMYWVAHDKRCVYLNHGFAPNMWCCHGRRADG